jgi:hypothetical protein
VVLDSLSLTVTVYKVEALAAASYPGSCTRRREERTQLNVGETVNVNVPVPPDCSDWCETCCSNALLLGPAVGITVLATIGTETTDNENDSNLDCGGDAESVTVTV